MIFILESITRRTWFLVFCWAGYKELTSIKLSQAVARAALLGKPKATMANVERLLGLGLNSTDINTFAEVDRYWAAITVLTCTMPADKSEIAEGFGLRSDRFRLYSDAVLMEMDLDTYAGYFAEDLTSLCEELTRERLTATSLSV